MVSNPVLIDGALIYTELDFHRMVQEKLALGPYYGKNLDALWDRLSTDVERPIALIWQHSQLSRTRLGPVFEKIVQILQDVQKQDEAFWPPHERFHFELQ